MIKTPFGYLKAVENNGVDYPSISIILCDEEGIEIDCVSFVEYDKKKNRIATYSYKQYGSDFDKKCVYKRGETNE